MPEINPKALQKERSDKDIHCATCGEFLYSRYSSIQFEGRHATQDQCFAYMKKRLDELEKKLKEIETRGVR